MSDDKDAGAPLPSDEPDYGTLPPKSLEKLFGVDVILKNPDDPTDGVFQVIKNKGLILCIRNPRSKRWLRYDKGTAQRLIDEAQNGVAIDVPTLLPVRIETRTSGRKRKSVDLGDVGETSESAKVVKKDRVLEKKNAKKNWRVATTAVRFSLRVREEQERTRKEQERVREEEETCHTGMSLEFDALDI